MDSKDVFDSEVREALAKVAIRFLSSIVALLPLAAGAFIVSLFLHELFSSPMGFMCKSVPPDRPAKAMRQRLERNHIAPAPITPEVAPPNPSVIEIPKPETLQE